MNYTDLAAASRGGIHQAPMTAVAPQAEVPYTKPDTQGGPNPVSTAVKAISKKWGPQPAPGEKADPEPPNPAGVLAEGAVKLGQHLWKGATEARGSVPGGLFGDVAEEA